MDRELTPKQQTSEAIRQAETVLIMTGQHPSVDQVAATVALTAILRKFGKKATAVISDDIPAGARFIDTKLVDRQLGGLRDFIVQVGLGRAEVDKLKYTIEDGSLNVHISPFAGGFRPEDVSFNYGDYQFDLVIVLGVASYARIDRVYAQNLQLLRQIPLVAIDFHRSNEQYAAINLIEGTAASLGEILVALSESLQPGLIDTPIATTLLAGIMAATDRFTATHTTSKALTVAAQMMAMGADQQQVVRGLYRGSERDKSQDRDKDKRQSQSQSGQGTGKKEREREAPRRPAEAQALPEHQPVASQATNPASAQQPQAIHPPPVQPRAPQTSAASHAPVAPMATPPVNPDPVALTNPEPPVAPLDPQPPVVPVPPSQPAPAPAVAPNPQPVQTASPQLDTSGPAVTDPDDTDERQEPPTGSGQTSRLDLINLQHNQPEPLINATSQPAATAQPLPNKPANPTNKPVFANRLP